MWALFYFIKDINNKTAKSLENGLMPWSRDLIIIINIINYLFIILFTFCCESYGSVDRYCLFYVINDYFATRTNFIMS